MPTAPLTKYYRPTEIVGMQMLSILFVERQISILCPLHDTAAAGPTFMGGKSSSPRMDLSQPWITSRAPTLKDRGLRLS